jgi:Beta-glucosidase/6-phospho-beta-glucosidase/beta-galactosidase
METFRLPENILLGSATAATQIEGGDKNNSWYEFSSKGKTKDGTSCLRADDHWNRYPEDIDLMVQLNHEIYRMGLEWSRIEPENGVFDPEAMKHYRQEIEMLLNKGIRPLVTLHHFSDPLWFTKEGGFEKASCVKYFERFTRYVVENLGDLVSEYITINEPNVYMVNGYYFGIWPPQKKDFWLGMRIYRNLTQCHIASYKTIHEVRKKMGFEGKTMVGVAYHLRVFDPVSRNPLDRIAAWAMQYLVQDIIMKSMNYGVYMPPLGLGMPKGNVRYYDFLGINYYTRSMVRFKGFKDEYKPDAPKNDLGWEIYPEGLHRLCRKYYKKYKAPIWITENGTCDKADDFRTKYIYDHFKEVSKLCEVGIPVERYYHWTLMDNFEWEEGESARFGLIAVDFETQKRTLRKSGEFFSLICRNKAITKNEIEMYL